MTRFLHIFKKSKGEIAAVLTVISAIIMVVGVFAGSRVGQINNTQSKAAEGGHCQEGKGGGTCNPSKNKGCYDPPDYNSGCCYWERCNDQGQCIDETELATKAPSYYSCGGGIYGCDKTDQCEKCVIDSRNLIPFYASREWDTSCSNHKKILNDWKNLSSESKKQYEDSLRGCKTQGCSEQNTEPYNPEGPEPTAEPEDKNSRPLGIIFLKPVVSYETKDDSDNLDGYSLQFEQFRKMDESKASKFPLEIASFTLDPNLKSQENKNDSFYFTYDSGRAETSFILFFIGPNVNPGTEYRGKIKIKKGDASKGFNITDLKACYPDIKIADVSEIISDLELIINDRSKLDDVAEDYIEDWNDFKDECIAKNDIQLKLTSDDLNNSLETDEEITQAVTPNETFREYIDKYIRNEISTEEMSAFISQLTRWPGMQMIPCDYPKGECVYKAPK